MRIVFDMQGAQGASRGRGIGRYSLSLALAMARQRGDHELVLALSGLFPETIEPIRAAFDDLLPQDNIRVWDALDSISFKSRHGARRRLMVEFMREAFIANLEPDLCHIPSMFEGLGDDVATSIGHFAAEFPIAVTLHDLIPHIHRDRRLTEPRIRAWYGEKLEHLRRASLLLAVSESARQEGLDWLGLAEDKIITARCAADERFRPLARDTAAMAALLSRYGISGGFVMYTGGDDVRKNMDALVRAFARLPDELRQRHQLVVVCRLSDSRREALKALAVSHGLAPDAVVVTGEVPDDDLIGLYNACTLFVFPSWHEGFGLPVLEAMSCGAPAIGSNTTSVPEVIGRADALFDPLSDESIAAKMAEVLANDELRTTLARHGLQQARRFSWDASARDAIAAFERVHAARRPMAVPRKPIRRRLAYVSPWPPDRSDIAAYSAELLSELARYYDVELICAKPRVEKPSMELGLQPHEPDWLRANAALFDRVLYQFGNSVSHEFMYKLLADVPGTVVLHDFFLSGFYAESERFLKCAPEWTRALYESHGYGAVRDWIAADDPDGIALKYPANFEVVRRAKGVIVHSEHARELAIQWYGAGVGAGWSVVPHLRVSPASSDRAAARAALGVPDDAFLVCCFGHLGELKLNDRLLAAWLQSALATDQHCHLVYVGACADDCYGRAFRARPAAAGDSGRIRMTGWNTPATYRSYLSAADVAVQLRVHSRGETSGAVLDCLNHGLPTIVSACGWAAELPADAALMLPDEFEERALVTALERLRRDGSYRAKLSAGARDFMRARHDPQASAAAYAAAIESFHERSRPGVRELVEAIAAQEVVPLKAERRRAAAAIARNHPSSVPARRLFVEVSELIQRDAQSGIQRVTRNILMALISKPPAGFRVEPVYATLREPSHRYARRFTLGLIGCPADWADDDVIDPQPGDVFLGLDLNQGITVAQADTLAGYRAFGVRVLHVLYDLLPVLRSDWFPAGANAAHSRWLETIASFDGVVAISRAVADEFNAWLAGDAPVRMRPLGIAWWPLGADLDERSDAQGEGTDMGRVPPGLHDRPGFLLVGTIEPRKGHAQALAAFERLWSSGVDINLVLVGKRGWMVDDLVKRLERHPESNKRLFWLDGIGDSDLEAVYAAASCLLAPSEGEGFGLPLIEAARHRLPILARDLPVFREVAGDHAAYFSGLDAESLAAALQDWLTAFRAGRHPRSDGMRWLTWDDSARALVDVILRDRWPMTWPPPQPAGEISPRPAQAVSS